MTSTPEVWLSEDHDPVTKAELAALITAAKTDANAARDLRERFDGQLEFGTAGLRGLLGAGPQRMNRVLVRKVAAGLAAYLLEHFPDAKTRGVAIARDARHNSREFAEDTVRVLGGVGIKSYLAPRGWPTPTAAWAVPELRACAGVMVTASHNPPAYNGYKVYWENGAQIIPPHDAGIAAAIEKIGRSDELPMPSLEALRTRGLLIDLDEAFHDRYIDRVLALRLGKTSDLVVAYTPMHGIGALSFERAMKRAGFANVHVEPAQREPDPDFPTVKFPNPEEKGAMDRVLALAKQVSADIVLANDPDADRLCVGVRDGDGYKVLTGDQVGALLADYLLEASPKDKRMVATTIVSSQLLSYLAKAAGADYRETLTGFKWIGNAAMDYEKSTGGRFVVGYEEALGYSVGPLVRDKDGISAALICADLVLWNRAKGRTVLAQLDDIYRRVGLFVTEQVSITKQGADGIAQIKQTMVKQRATPPKEIAGIHVDKVEDLIHGEGGLPPSDVLVYRLAGGRRVIVRPSGTEPKLKAYYEVRVEVTAGEPMDEARKRGIAELAQLRDAHQKLLS